MTQQICTYKQDKTYYSVYMDDLYIRFQYFSVLVDRGIDTDTQYLCLFAPILIAFYNYIKFIEALMRIFDREIRQHLLSRWESQFQNFEEFFTAFYSENDHFEKPNFRKHKRNNKYKRFRQKSK